MTKHDLFLAVSVGVLFGVTSAFADEAQFRILVPINPGVALFVPNVTEPEEQGLANWSLLPSALPEAEVGTEYSFEFSTLLEFDPPELALSNISWSGDPLPEWLVIDQETGAATGTPEEAGQASFSVTATHADKGFRQRGYTIVVNGVTMEVTQVATGADGHTCAITTEGGVMCWGSNEYYQLGDGGHGHGPTPVQVVGLDSGVTAISAGNDHTCAIRNGGAVCWGYDDNGKLGDGSLQEAPIPVQVFGLTSGVTAISAGPDSTCAVHNGAAKCWGGNSSVPVPVSTLNSGVSAISVGNGFTCAVHNGAAKCWGAGGSGQLGNGGTVGSAAPAQVSGLESGVTVISAGSNHACAVQSGSAKCWGNGQSGKLGDGASSNNLSPDQVAGLTSGVTQISAGGAHTCAVRNGAAKCWGAASGGVLGNGASSGTFSMPVDVTGLNSGVSYIDASTGHSCATHGETVKCWGFGSAGQLGSGYADSAVPIQVVF